MGRDPKKFASQEFNYDHLWDWLTDHGLGDGYRVRLVLLPDGGARQYRVVAQLLAVAEGARVVQTSEGRWPCRQWRRIESVMLAQAMAVCRAEEERLMRQGV